MTALPATMRYVTTSGPGGPEVLGFAEGPVPTPGPDDVLIRVAAAGINRPDILQREGESSCTPTGCWPRGAAASDCRGSYR